MRHPFALLGGSAFLALVLAACKGASFAILFSAVSAGVGILFLLGLAGFYFTRRRAEKQEKEALVPKRAELFFRKLLFPSLALLTAAFCLFRYAHAWNTRISPVERLIGTEAKISGTVLDYPEERRGKSIFLLEVEQVTVDGRVQALPAFTVRLSSWNAISCHPCDRLECTVKFFTFSSGGGLYSTRNSYLADGVELGAYFSDYEKIQVIPGEESPPGKFFAQLRHRLGRSFEKRLPKAESGLIRAMLLGEKSRIPQEGGRSFRKIGAYHLLVISGLHMAALAAFLAFLFGRLPIGRVGKNLLTAGAILGFLLLTAFPVSAVRSGIMYILALLAGCLGRRTDSVNSLGVAVFVICVGNPFSGGDLGFALSACSTLGILLLGSKISGALLRPFEARFLLRRMFTPVAASLGMTFSAVLFTLPVQMLVFQELCLLAPLSSLLLVYPCTLLLYCALLSAFFGGFPLLAPLAEPFTLCAGWLARFSLETAERLAALPNSVLDLSQPVWAVAVVGIVLLLFTLLFVKRSRGMTAAVLLGVVFLAGCGAFLTGTDPGTVTVAAVPNSTCVAVLRGDRAAVLSLGGYQTDAAEALLTRNGVRRVELICFPVRDRDAREGAAYLLKAFPVERLALPENAYLGREVTLLAEDAWQLVWRDGEELEVLDGVKLTPSSEMARITIEANGVSVIVETGESGEGTCQVLFTTQQKSQIDSPFTVLQNDAIIGEYRSVPLGELPPGRYLAPDGNGLYLELFPDGTSNFRGESMCLN